LTGFTSIHRGMPHKTMLYHLGIPSFGNHCRSQTFLYTVDMRYMFTHSDSWTRKLYFM